MLCCDCVVVVLFCVVCCFVLCCVVCCAVLCCAVLWRAVLCCAVLCVVCCVLCVVSCVVCWVSCVVMCFVVLVRVSVVRHTKIKCTPKQVELHTVVAINYIKFDCIASKQNRCCPSVNTLTRHW